jgi:hypothetical protein
MYFNIRGRGDLNKGRARMHAHHILQSNPCRANCESRKYRG